MKIKFIFLIIFAFFLANCKNQNSNTKKGFIFNEKLSSNLEQDFKNEKNTRNIAEILQYLQDQEKSNKTLVFNDNKISSKVWIDGNKNFVKQYSYFKKETKFYEFLPIISYFLPKFYENKEIVIVFNKKNEVLDIESFYNKIRINSEFFCNPPKKSCIAKIY